MRTLVAMMLSVALAVPALATQPEDQPGLEVGNAISATYINLVYLPAKVAMAAIGAVSGGIAAVVSGGDQRAAYALWVPLMGGDYFVRAENLSGERPLAFFGSDYTDRPSQAGSSTDRTYAYDALYN